MDSLINVGVIGYGYWGPNLVRNFAELDGCHLVAVSDLNPARLDLVRRRYPSVNVTTNTRDLIENPGIDFIVLSTPVSTHYSLALKALQAGKHVLVEKPLTMSAEESLRLIDEAARRNLMLMVDHTFVYHGAVRKMKEIVSSGDLGELYYFDSVRVNLGLFQHDVDVLWDLAVHDISILNYLIVDRPSAVTASGMAHVAGRMEDVAYLTVFYNSNFIAHIHANWLAPAKIRRTTIGGNRKMVIYDDLEQSEKVKVYEKGISTSQSPESIYKTLISYRTGDMHAPQFDTTEALRTEALHALDCIRSGKQPITDGVAGLKVVEILECASRSMRMRGNPVESPHLAVATADL